MGDASGMIQSLPEDVQRLIKRKALARFWREAWQEHRRASCCWLRELRTLGAMRPSSRLGFRVALRRGAHFAAWCMAADVDFAVALCEEAGFDSYAYVAPLCSAASLDEVMAVLRRLRADVYGDNELADELLWFRGFGFL